MQIRRIDTTSAHDVRRFIGVPFELYRACPQWVPAFLPDMRLALDRVRHPFYRHSDADFYVAENGNRALGRIAVIDNHNYNAHHGRRDGFFYYFEAVHDAQVARELFDAALEWARGRGLTRLIGPKGLLTGDGLGLLVDGFQHRPALGIPYNHPYYAEMLRASGFEKETDYLSGHLSGTHQLSARFDAIAERVKKQRGLEVRSFTSKRELRRLLPQVTLVYNRAFADNWEFCPVTQAEVDVFADRLEAIADPRLIKLVMKGEQIVGFILAYPDISSAIQRTGGRIWPFGWIAVLREFKRTKVVNLNGVGLIEGFRGVGANTLLYTEVARSIHASGYEHAEVVQVEEKNSASLRDMAAIGVKWHKRHRIYGRTL